eukprot:m.287681 g.287681  ORF g.287681 m.287681 type:complete len:74 (+) comp16363_c0_seq2:59-280(+)
MALCLYNVIVFIGNLNFNEILQVTSSSKIPSKREPGQPLFMLHIVTLRRTYHMIAPNKETRDYWMHAIRLICP